MTQANQPEANAAKKVIFSGIQPTAVPTLGNYLGAIRNWVKLQDDYDCIYCVVDLHAITVRQDPTKLRKQALDLMALLVACGLSPDKNLLFFQSHVMEHAHLAWMLNCFTYMGELSRMTQYKDKSAKHADNINAGLFTYPVLMASDILLYNTALVPVGDDQRQHLELARDIAIRMNNLLGDVFTVPEGYISKSGARIMSLTEPERKMDKSGEEASKIGLLDTPEIIRAKFRRAVTDSDGEIRYDPKAKPGVSNLLDVLAVLTEAEPAVLARDYEGKGYGVLKDAVADAVIAALAPVHAEYARIRGDKAALQAIIDKGAPEAQHRARRMLSKVHRKLGFAPFQA